MGYILKKTYEAGKYNKYAPDSNLVSTERLDFIQPTGLKQIVNTVTGDKLDLISDVNETVVVPDSADDKRQQFNIKYGGEDYHITVDMYNKAWGLEDDNTVHSDYLGTLDAASGLTKNQNVRLHMQAAGNLNQPILAIKVDGPNEANRKWIASNFSLNADFRHTYIDYASYQTVETYWNWWAKPVGDVTNNRRTTITKLNQKAHAYNAAANLVFLNQIVATYASWNTVSTYVNDDTNNTSTFGVNLKINVSNQPGEQGLIAGVYNWDVKFNSSDLVDGTKP